MRGAQDPGRPDRLVAVARDALRWVTDAAVATGDGLSWPETRAPGEPLTDDLYAGTAGVLIALAEARLAGLSEFDDHARAAAGRLRGLARTDLDAWRTVAAREPAGEEYGPDPGLYTGLAGTMTALDIWGQASGDLAARQAARDTAEGLARIAAAQPARRDAGRAAQHPAGRSAGTGEFRLVPRAGRHAPPVPDPGPRAARAWLGGLGGRRPAGRPPQRPSCAPVSRILGQHRPVLRNGGRGRDGPRPLPGLRRPSVADVGCDAGRRRARPAHRRRVRRPVVAHRAPGEPAGARARRRLDARRRRHCGLAAATGAGGKRWHECRSDALARPAGAGPARARKPRRRT